jgi:putative endonuclease
MARRVPTPPTRWADPRHRLGFAGEDAARRFLEARGWSVEAHRFRVGRHELDLIVRRGSLVAFVEVKTRRGNGYGAGREAIGWRKRQALGRAAEVWRIRHGREGDTYRFDVVEVRPDRGVGGGGTPQVVHIPDAWRLDR